MRKTEVNKENNTLNYTMESLLKVALVNANDYQNILIKSPSLNGFLTNNLQPLPNDVSKPFAF